MYFYWWPKVAQYASSFTFKMKVFPLHVEHPSTFDKHITNKYLVGVTVEQLYSTQLLEIQKLMVTGLSSLYKYVRSTKYSLLIRKFALPS